LSRKRTNRGGDLGVWPREKEEITVKNFRKSAFEENQQTGQELTASDKSDIQESMRP